MNILLAYHEKPLKIKRRNRESENHAIFSPFKIQLKFTCKGKFLLTQISIDANTIDVDRPNLSLRRSCINRHSIMGDCKNMLTKKDGTKNETKNSKNAKNPTSGTHLEGHAGCCQPPAKAPSQLPAKSDAAPASQKQSESFEKKGSAKTRITVKYDIGFSNQLYIRGQGGNLSWSKGEPFKNIKADEWVWETDASFTQCEFKVLINDRIYESGDNHILKHGTTLLYTPNFY